MRTRHSVRYSRPRVRILRAVAFALIVAAGLPVRDRTWAQPVGAEFQVNAYTTGAQRLPAVAADADGNFVVVWESQLQDANSTGVFGRRYTSAAIAVGGEFQVNTYTTGFQYNPAVAADSDGDFVVVWHSYQQDGSYSGVFGQRYTSAGAAVDGEFQVNTYTTGAQFWPAVAADADGDFVVVWSDYSFPSGQDGSLQGVFGQRYTSAGVAIGAEFQVNTYTTNVQDHPAVAADSDGNFVVVWESTGQDGSVVGVFGQRYTSAGVAIGAEFQVNPYTTNVQDHPAVAADSDGNFVVVWESTGQGSENEIFGQRYTSAGATAGAEFQVNTYTSLAQSWPAVAADADGNIVVVWQSDGQDGGRPQIFGQLYASDGATVGGEFQVNTYTAGLQYVPAVAAADASFVVVWTGERGDDAQGVSGRRLLPPEAVTEPVAAGGTVTADAESDGATAGDPVETTITSPNAGTISILEQAATGSPPSGFQFVGQAVTITAPAATAGDPLVLVFEIDASAVPAGEDQNSIVVFRDGVAVPGCTGSPGTADPDPCVSSRVLQGDGDVEMTVLTSSASDWNFGVQESPAPIPALSPFGVHLCAGLFLLGMGWALRRRLASA